MTGWPNTSRLHLAWMWEDLHREEESRQARQQAVGAFKEAYVRSQAPGHDQQLAYLVGVLLMQCGNPHEAHQYLLRAIDRKSPNAWLNARARDLLASLRTAR